MSTVYLAYEFDGAEHTAKLTSWNEATSMGVALTARAVPTGIGDTAKRALGGLDDVRKVCSVCNAGRGSHRCNSCQATILQAALSASLHVCGRPQVRR